MSELAHRPPTAHDRTSALDGLLAHARVHEQMGGRPSRFLLSAAVLANATLALMVLLGSALHVDGVRRSGFFLVGGDTVASLIGFLQGLRWPLLLTAGAGLMLNYWSRGRRTPPWVHSVLALQILPTIALAFGWLAVAVLFALALILWILLIAAIAALTALFVGTLIAGAGS